MLGGEDTTLAARLGVAFTRGIQRGSVPESKYRMVNTIAKHLSAYSGPEGYCGGVSFGTQTRFSFTARMDERTWREFFLPPWRAMAVEANVSGFMSSYQAVDTGSGAVPDSSSRLLLTDVIRGEWNWSGYVLSDAGAVAFVGDVDWQGAIIGHGVATNTSDAAVRALTAGLDLELTCCELPAVYPTLTASVQAGIISEAVVDTALRRTLPIRFELGTLDPPGSSPYDNFTSANVSAPWMVGLALEAAQQGLVLLKNRPAGAPGGLPWRRSSLAGRTIAVVGFTANQTQGQEGGYVNQHPPFIRTTLDGITDAFPLSVVTYEPGCPTYACAAFNATAVAAAVAGADAVVIALGTTVTNGVIPGSPCEPDQLAVEAEGWDRAGTALPGQQLALLQAVVAAAAPRGVPVVLVLINAGMLDIGWALESPGVAAVLHAPMLGMTSGTAIAGALAGDVNPGGRLTHTWYTPAGLATIGDITDYRMHPDAAAGYPGRTYRYTSAPVLLPFGFGLSYSAWRYGDLTVDPPAPRPCDEVRVSVTVYNDSPVDGSEVVQAYVTIHNVTVPTPLRALVDFARVAVPAHSSAVVQLRVPPRLNAVLDAQLETAVEPGPRTLWVGGASDPAAAPGVQGGWETVGPATPVAACEAAA